MPPRGLQERPKRVQETELGLKLLGDHQGISFLARSEGILAPFWRILASKTPPRCLQEPPRRLQEPPSRPQEPPRCPHEPPGCVLGGSIGSAISEEFCSWRVPSYLGSTWPSRRLREPPKRLQEPPRHSKTPPGRLQDAFKSPQEFQDAPKTSKTRPGGFSPLCNFRRTLLLARSWPILVLSWLVLASKTSPRASKTPAGPRITLRLPLFLGALLL